MPSRVGSLGVFDSMCCRARGTGGDRRRGVQGGVRRPPDLFVGVAAIVIETEGVDLDAIRSALADITAGGDSNRADARSAGAGQWARGRV